MQLTQRPSDKVLFIPGMGIQAVNLGASAFLPTDITGLQLWLKADAITGLIDGDPVTTWPDGSGLANNATQSTVAKKPTFKTAIQNGLPVVRFDGVDDSMSLPNFLSALTAGELFIVLNRRLAGNQGSHTFGPASGGSYYGFSDVLYDEFGSTVRRDAFAPVPVGWNVYGISAAAGSWTARFNGVSQFSTATNTVGFHTAPAIGVNHINFYSAHDWGEVLIYDSKLSDANRQAVETHLVAKWGIA